MSRPARTERDGARDTKLNREVAIKMLPPALANDADYLARFEREAQVVASLNHPNIAAIYGLEGNAIVMEMVEGQALCGPMPVDDASALARQIAEALEAAHENGIVHRDLKPGNVKVTPASGPAAEGANHFASYRFGRRCRFSTVRPTCP
jgi:serine/threonine-protein kinase